MASRSPQFCGFIIDSDGGSCFYNLKRPGKKVVIIHLGSLLLHIVKS